jgi:hypothetical protein
MADHQKKPSARNLNKTLILATLVITLASTPHATFAASSGKKLSAESAEKILGDALVKTQNWMKTKAFTVSVTEKDKGYLYNSQFTVDNFGNTRFSEDGKINKVVIGKNIYISPASLTYSIDDLMVKAAKKLELTLTKNWAKDSFEENWSDNYPDIYSYSIKEVRNAYLDSQIADSMPRENLFIGRFYDDLLTAFWYPKGKDSGTLKISQKAIDERKSEILTVVIEKGKIVSTLEQTGSTAQIQTKYQTFDKKITPPKGPYLSLDQIRNDRDYQLQRTEYLAKLISYAINREAIVLATFEGVDKPTLRTWEDAVRASNNKAITFYVGAFEITIKYGVNSYIYCAPDAETFATAGKVVLSGTCAAAGFLPRNS